MRKKLFVWRNKINICKWLKWITLKLNELHIHQWKIRDNETKGVTKIYSSVATHVMGMQLSHMLGLPVSHCIWKECHIKTHLCCIWYLSCDASCCQLRSSLRLEHVVLAKSALCVAVGSTAFLMSKPTSKSNDKSELCPSTWGLELTAFTLCRDVQVSCGSMLLTWSVSMHSAWDDGFALSVKKKILKNFVTQTQILFIIPTCH